MKKYLLLIFAMSIAATVNSQLLVDSLGNIGIKAGDSIVKSTVSINSAGDNTYDFYLQSDRANGMYINNTNGNYNGTSYGLRVYNTSNHRGISTTAYGVYSEVNNNISTGNDVVYALFGQATRGQHVYGTFGRVLSSNITSGAGICGSIDQLNPNISGIYAGYFNGAVYYTDTIYAPYFYMPVTNNDTPEPLPEPEPEPTSYSATSTSGTSILNNLIQVKAVKYNTATAAAGTASTAATISSDAAVKYGIDITTLMQQFPGTIAINAEGDTCVDYFSLIPVLLQAIKELQVKVASLKENSNSNLLEYSGKPNGTTELSSSNVDATIVASLSQNTPNPFSEATTIAFTLPQSVKEAMICIYDMNGTQLEQIDIVERGASSVQIDGYKLNAGMYLYSLIADGNVIDTKRMVLTK